MALPYLPWGPQHLVFTGTESVRCGPALGRRFPEAPPNPLLVTTLLRGHVLLDAPRPCPGARHAQQCPETARADGCVDQNIGASLRESRSESVSVSVSVSNPRSWSHLGCGPVRQSGQQAAPSSVARVARECWASFLSPTYGCSPTVPSVALSMPSRAGIQPTASASNRF